MMLIDDRCLELAKVLVGDLHATTDELRELAEIFQQAADDLASAKRREEESKDGPRANLRTPWISPR
jgi:hypothetical protein